jgi:hypothetical protein
MKRMIAFAALSFGLVTAASALELNVTNKSKTAIHHLYLSASSQKSWGPDQLGEQTVEPGEKFKLHGIEAGKYDVKVVTANDQECEVDDADFDTSMEWVITEHMLAKCSG